MTKQPAFDFGQRQDSCDASIALCKQEMSTVIERPLDDALPACTMKKRCLRMFHDIGIPPREINTR